MQYNAVSKRLRDGFALSAFQMRRNELKYSFYHQNPASFPGIYLLKELFINSALPASHSVCRQNFMGKNCQRQLILHVCFTFDALAQ